MRVVERMARMKERNAYRVLVGRHLGRPRRRWGWNWNAFWRNV